MPSTSSFWARSHTPPTVDVRGWVGENGDRLVSLDLSTGPVTDLTVTLTEGQWANVIGRLQTLLPTEVAA